jgi:hypothetical protein
MSLGLKPSKKPKELVGALKALRHPKPRHPKTGDTAPPETDDAAHPKLEFFSKLFSYEIGDPTR